MENRKISPLSAACMFILFMLSGIQVMNLFEQSKHELWLSALVAAALSIPALLIYYRLVCMFPGEGLFSIFIKSLGRFFGTVFCVLYTVYAMGVAATSFRLLSEFIKIVSLPKTPEIIILLIFGYLFCRSVKSGASVFSRFCVCLLPLTLIIFLFITALSAGLYDGANLTPVRLYDLPGTLEAAVGITSLSFGEAVFLIGFLTLVSRKNGTPGTNKVSVRRIILWSTVISALFISGIMLSNLLVLGGETMNKLYFPYYAAVSLIDAGGFITHIEVIAVITFILTSTVKVGVCLYVAADGVGKIFCVKNPENLLFPVAFLIIILALRLFDNPPGMLSFTSFNKYTGVIFQLPLPLIALIAAEIKRRRHSK